MASGWGGIALLFPSTLLQFFMWILFTSDSEPLAFAFGVFLARCVLAIVIMVGVSRSREWAFWWLTAFWLVLFLAPPGPGAASTFIFVANAAPAVPFLVAAVAAVVVLVRDAREADLPAKPDATQPQP